MRFGLGTRDHQPPKTPEQQNANDINLLAQLELDITNTESGSDQMYDLMDQHAITLGRLARRQGREAPQEDKVGFLTKAGSYMLVLASEISAPSFLKRDK